MTEQRGLRPEDVDLGFGTVSCVECGNPTPRKSNVGALPKYCDPCKADKHSAKTRESLNRLRGKFGRESLPDGEELAQLQKEARSAQAVRPEPAADPPTERTWLDDAEAQELLRQKREAELASGQAYNPEIHGSVEDFLMSSHRVERVVPVGQKVATDAEPPPAEPNPLQGPAAICVVDFCGMPDPPHVGRFCANHWQRIGLEDRNVLLGSPPGSEPFNQAVRRIAAKLGT